MPIARVARSLDAPDDIKLSALAGRYNYCRGQLGRRFGADVVDTASAKIASTISARASVKNSARRAGCGGRLAGGGSPGTGKQMGRPSAAAGGGNCAVIARLDLAMRGKFCRFGQGVKKRRVGAVLVGNTRERGFGGICVMHRFGDTAINRVIAL